jgi:uncharacterized protein YbjT (DUF2867 family)
MKTLITGFNGNVGQAIVQAWPHPQQPNIVVAGRRLEDKPANFTGGFVQLDLLNESTYAPALQGISRLFLLRPPALADASVFAVFLDAVVQAGVQEVAFLSVQGVEQSPKIPHHKIEQLIKDRPLSYVFFRPGYFMQNLSTTLRAGIVEKHEIFLPVGKTLFNWVDVSDIGVAIAHRLTDETPFANEIYTLTGASRAPFSEAVELLSTTLGIKITLRSPSVLSFYFTMVRAGHDKEWVKVLIMLHYLPRFSPPPPLTNDLAQLLGRPAGTLAEFIERSAEVWRG